MQSTNKVLCNFSQGLTELEKYTARGNIGTFGMYEITASEQSETVGSGSINLQYTVGNASHTGVYLLNLDLTVDPDGTVPTDKAVPCIIFADLNRPGGGVTPLPTFTSALNRVESTGGYKLETTVMLPVHIEDSTSFRFVFEFETGKLPVGTIVKFNASGVLIGNFDPTP